MQKWKPNYVLLNNHFQVLIIFFAKADTDTDTKGVLGNTIAFVSQIFSITLLWYTTSHDKHLLHNVSV